MRCLESCKEERQNMRFVSLQAWLRKVFLNGRMRKRNQKNIKELHELSHHLLDDLGFDGKAQPIRWSSAPKELQSSNAETADNSMSECQHHPHCRNAVGSLS